MKAKDAQISEYFLARGLLVEAIGRSPLHAAAHKANSTARIENASDTRPALNDGVGGGGH